LAKGSAAIRWERCKVCGICVAVCPADNLEVVEGRLVAGDLCTGCKLCELHCPDFAIAAERVATASQEQTPTDEGDREGDA